MSEKEGNENEMMEKILCIGMVMICFSLAGCLFLAIYYQRYGFEEDGNDWGDGVYRQPEYDTVLK